MNLLFSFLTLTEDAIVHLCINIRRNKFKIFYEYDLDVTDIDMLFIYVLSI